MSDETKPIGLNPWEPVTDRLYLKMFGKLQEELGELSSAASRCMIQGLNESEPTTGKVNWLWLQEEMADVTACMTHIVDKLKLNIDRIELRSKFKYDHLQEWFDM